MNIFDTHSHYDDEQFNPDRDELLKALPHQGVSFVVSCGCDLATTKINKELAEKYSFVYFAAGFHPENLEGANTSDIELLKEYLSHPKCVALGEIGLDYHWMDSTKEVQKDFFTKQIQLANELNMPIIVHDREAHGDTLEILKKYKPKGVVHCFSGSKEMAKDIIDIGMYIGFNGVITFKNARKSIEVLHEIPIERLVLETDCPYLAPEPIRGIRNNSANIIHIAKRIADELGKTTEEIINITNNNAKKLYGIEKEAE